MASSHRLFHQSIDYQVNHITRLDVWTMATLSRNFSWVSLSLLDDAEAAIQVWCSRRSSRPRSLRRALGGAPRFGFGFVRSAPSVGGKGETIQVPKRCVLKGLFYVIHKGVWNSCRIELSPLDRSHSTNLLKSGQRKSWMDWKPRYC